MLNVGLRNPNARMEQGKSAVKTVGRGLNGSGQPITAAKGLQNPMARQNAAKGIVRR